MLKLIKFEFSRKKTMYLISLVLLVIAEAFALFKYFELGGNVRDFIGDDIFGIYSGILLVSFSLLYLIDIIFLFREDLFKQEGYMLFMTPNSGYKLLSSKLLFALLEGIMIFGIYFVVLLVNIKIMDIGSINFIVDQFTMKETWVVIKMLMTIMFGLMQFALIVYLSFALFKSLFSNQRFKGLITFGIFLVINYGIVKIQQVILKILPFESEMKTIFNENSTIDAVSIALNNGLLMGAISVVLLFIGTGYLLENKINL